MNKMVTVIYLQEASQDEFVDKHRGSVGVVEDEGETQPVRNQVHRRIICQQEKKKHRSWNKQNKVFTTSTSWH